MKYRIWDKENKNYYNKDDIVLEPDGDLAVRRYSDIYEDTWLGAMDQENYVIERYTGIKDKNGVEIYEGDILKQNHAYIDTDKRDWVGEVKYLNLEYCGRYENGFVINLVEREQELNLKIHVNCEVVMNIFENTYER